MSKNFFGKTQQLKRNLTANFYVLEIIAIFLVLAVIILLIVHPWKHYFVFGLGKHWDSHLMGEWLAWNAHNILKGQFLIPNYHANFFYPHSYTLAFSEPFWPQSFVYALVYGISKNPYLSFNATFLFFWALAGVCMVVFLRELKIRREVSYFGGLTFCLLPYLLVYAVYEFNMILVFIFPFNCTFFVRWLRNISLRNAIFFALAYWISMVSCLYYSIILCVPLGCILLGFLAKDRSLVWNKQLYKTGFIAILIIAILGGIYLYPYAILRMAGYARSLDDQMKNINNAQPLSYLLACGRYYAHQYISIIMGGLTRRTETTIFPGITLTLLVCFYWLKERIILRSGKNLLKYTLIENLAWSRFILWCLFWIIVVWFAINNKSSPGLMVSIIVQYSILSILVISIALLFLREERRYPNHVISGLAVGSLMAFIMSLGPVITTGPETNIVKLSTGPMAFFYQIFPILQAIRVTSRFSIVVLTFFIVAACFYLNSLVIKKRLICQAMLSILCLFIIAETFTVPYKFYDYKKFDSKVKVWKILQEMPNKVTIFQLPAGPRELEAKAVAYTIGNFNYTLNGHSGFYPKWHYDLAVKIMGGNIPEAISWLSQIWPEVYLVIDLSPLSWWQRYKKSVFTEKYLDEKWIEVARDRHYVLYKLKPSIESAKKIIRRIRTDVLRDNPIFMFQARKTGLIRNTEKSCFRVTVNNHEIGQYILNDTWQQFEIKIPEKFTGKISGENVYLELIENNSLSKNKPSSEKGWEVKQISFVKH